MSGIAGILRRDGGPVPKKWGDLLEQALMFGGGIPSRFEDSIPVERGELQILLLSGSGIVEPCPSGLMIIDGDFEGECAFARWNEETLELELGRKGTGQKSLYWFDLAEAGDGLLFCTNPLPLLKIARELELPNDHFAQGVQEYLQDGFVVEGGELFSPVCSMPLQPVSQKCAEKTSELCCEFTTTLAEDVQTLVRLLGAPFADPTLLSTLQQYRFAKENGCCVVEGLAVPESKQFFTRFSSTKQIEKQKMGQRFIARRIELGAIADYVGVQLSISEEQKPLETIPFPLASWLRNPQSNLSQLAGDIFHSDSAFENLPIQKKSVLDMFASHQQESQDHAVELFSLLTLVLWSQLVHA
jgi:hypothetical protein